MELTNKEKLKMCIEHLEEGKSLSHICERYNYKDISKLKYSPTLESQFNVKLEHL